ncbi:MAG: hypothetical protein CBD27_08530 [Rhodospirillaceae bacterium TMED167]|nr:hypothetical protein [Rhodospirillaceae bacterium]MAI12183.1 hypothetical protein [Rhodospirillaceae bacterium]OUW24597.1 MAG: hypothetical protein CBD27_11005 [Rhodospirillaceae bacterium TMED167]OUW26081.1 MAG: hypothetical protein CBD27_08530 [Rhodospirillaceae bacterium TMED167]
MDKIEISLGGYQPPASVHNRAARILGRELQSRFKEAVSYTMDGNMVTTQGVKAIDLLDLVESGDLTLCYFASSYLADRIPEIGIFDLPFVIESRETAYAALDGALGDLLKKRFSEETGFRILAFWDNGFRHFSNGVKPIRTPADCAGLKIRSMNSDLHQAFFRRLGFDPAFVDVRDLVAAVENGTIDAQENPLTNTYNFGTHKYHRYITLSGHFFGMVLLLIQNDTFIRWPEHVQSAVIESVDVATQAQRGFAAAEDADIMAVLDSLDNEIVHLTKRERAAFQDAVAPLLATQRDVLGEALFDLVG